jgi:hypothetical protein
MDADVFERVRSLWPDVAPPFSRIVPDGCDFLRASDDWRPGLRVRKLLLRRGQGAPPIAELLEEACEDAERRGWCRLEDEHSFELESVILRVEKQLIQSTAVLSVRFEQPWPVELGAPVETSEIFQRMVRQVLGLGGEPVRLLKEVSLEVLHERVELPLDPKLIAHLPRVGFAYDETVEAWVIEQSFDVSDMRALVRESFDRVTVEVNKTLSRS